MQQLCVVTAVCNGKGKYRSRERRLAGKTTTESGVPDTAGIVLVYLCKDLIPTTLSEPRWGRNH